MAPLLSLLALSLLSCGPGTIELGKDPTSGGADSAGGDPAGGDSAGEDSAGDDSRGTVTGDDSIPGGDTGSGGDSSASGDSSTSGDSGTPDTGTPDTGTPDTGTPDTGTPDTGTPDTAGPGDTSGPPPEPSDCVAYGFVADTSLYLGGGSTFDSYDASAGAYGGANVGSAAGIAVNDTGACALTYGAAISGDVWTGADPVDGVCAEWGGTLSGAQAQLPAAVAMPTYSVPAGLPASSGAVSLGFGDSRTVTGDERYDSLYVGFGSTLTVTAPATLYVAGDLALDSGVLDIASGAVVELYVDGDVRAGFGATVNTTGEPGRLRLHVQGSVTIDYGGGLSAVVESPSGAFANYGGTFSGTWIGESATTSWGAVTHVDVSGVCGA